NTHQQAPRWHARPSVLTPQGARGGDDAERAPSEVRVAQLPPSGGLSTAERLAWPRASRTSHRAMNGIAVRRRSEITSDAAGLIFSIVMRNNFRLIPIAGGDGFLSGAARDQEHASAPCRGRRCALTR
ncbi:unnamed protein product, partial [Lampetra fluviatilis]